MSPLSTLICVALSLKSANKLCKHLIVCACGLYSVPFCHCGFFSRTSDKIYFTVSYKRAWNAMPFKFFFAVAVVISLTVGNICCLIYRHRSMLQFPIVQWSALFLCTYDKICEQKTTKRAKGNKENKKIIEPTTQANQSWKGFSRQKVSLSLKSKNLLCMQYIICVKRSLMRINYFDLK